MDAVLLVVRLGRASGGSIRMWLLLHLFLLIKVTMSLERRYNDLGVARIARLSVASSSIVLNIYCTL